MNMVGSGIASSTALGCSGCARTRGPRPSAVVLRAPPRHAPSLGSRARARARADSVQSGRPMVWTPPLHTSTCSPPTAISRRTPSSRCMRRMRRSRTSNAADTTTWFATLAWLSIRKSYALLLWLFNQGSKDLVVIQKSMGIEVDDSLLAWYEKVTPMAQVNDRPPRCPCDAVLPILYYLSAKPSPRSTMRCLWYANAHWNTVALWFDGCGVGRDGSTRHHALLPEEVRKYLPHARPARPHAGGQTPSYRVLRACRSVVGASSGPTSSPAITQLRARAPVRGASATGLLANVLIPPAAKGASVDGSRSEVAAVTTPTQQPRAEVATAAAVGAGKLAAKKEA